jgi:hypothetical protein
MVTYARHSYKDIDLGEQLNELVIKKQAIVQERFCTGRKTFASDAKGQTQTRSSFALLKT